MIYWFLTPKSLRLEVFDRDLLKIFNNKQKNLTQSEDVKGLNFKNHQEKKNFDLRIKMLQQNFSRGVVITPPSGLNGLKWHGWQGLPWTQRFVGLFSYSYNKEYIMDPLEPLSSPILVGNNGTAVLQKRTRWSHSLIGNVLLYFWYFPKSDGILDLLICISKYM